MTDTSIASRGFYDTIARYYDAENENMTYDLELYSGLAEQTRGTILDIGCGTGRITLHLAGQGHKVSGIDVSTAMLARAQRKVKNRIDLTDHVQLFEGDATTYKFPEKYGLIIVPYNTLMHFHTPEDQLALLHHLPSAMADDGLLVIDLPNAGETFGSMDDNAVRLERSFIEPETGNMVMQQSVSTLNRTDQLQHITWIYDEIDANNVVHRTVGPLTLRYIFPNELDLMFRLCGLERVETYGDYDEQPFEEGCERLIVVARKVRK
jgi:SAM-dependent methyltransferase